MMAEFIFWLICQSIQIKFFLNMLFSAGSLCGGLTITLYHAKLNWIK